MELSAANPMPQWALSGGPLIWRRLQGDTGARLGGQIAGALMSAGWVQTVTLGSGVTLQATSPQSALALTVLLDVTWGSDYCDLQFHGTATGYLHQLGCASGRQFQIVAGPCQFFISIPTDPGESFGSAVAGGIPYISPGCSLYPDGAAPDEVWWSIGDCYGSPFFATATPRTGLGYQDAFSGEQAWCGYFHRPGDNPAYALVMEGQAAALMLVELLLAGTFSVGDPLLTMRYPNLEPLAYEPLLVWGDYIVSPYPASDYPPKVRGQLWDAVIESGGQDYQATLEGTAPDVEGLMYFDAIPHQMRWLNYSLGLNNGNLYLLLPGLGLGNIAY